MQYYKAVVALSYLHHAEVVHYSVAVEVKVIKVTLFGVELLFKLFEVVYFAEQGGNGFEVEVLCDVGGCGRDGDGFVCTSGKGCHQNGYRKKKRSNVVHSHTILSS